MLSKKMKSILAVALCAVMAVVAIPNYSANAEDTETTTCTDCAEFVDYKMTSDKAFPEAGKWADRVLTDQEDGSGLHVDVKGGNSGYVTRTKTPVNVDGAHMKLTFGTGNNQFYVTINNQSNSGEYTSHKLGISFKINLYSGGTIACTVDNVPQETVTGMFTSGSGAVEMKTSITDAGDFVFTINDYDYVISNEVWANSSNISADTPVYFAVAPGVHNINYTWNYIHGGADVCYSEVSTVDSLIVSMITEADIIAARKAYLALSDVEQAVVENAEALMATAGTLSGDSGLYKMTSDKAYPAADKWPTARVLTDREDGSGLRVQQVVGGNNNAYVTRTSTRVKLDGAHLKLNFATGTNKFLVTINSNTAGDYSNHEKGFCFTISLYSGGSIACNIDKQSIGTMSGVSNIGINSGEVEIKTSIMEDNEFVFTINGYDYKISSDKWVNSTNINADSVYFMIAPSGNTLDYTWNYFHGGADVCCEGIADVEKKIELCHPTTPIKANVDAARTAYDGLSDELKAIVINFNKLTSAEANAEASDFYHHGITEGKFLSSSTWANVITQQQVANGWNIKYSANLNLQYRVRTSQAFTLDGLHAGITLKHNGGDYIVVSLSNKNDTTHTDSIYLTLDTRNKTAVDHGNKYYLGYGASSPQSPKNTSTAGLVGQYDDYAVNFPDISDNNEMDIRFDIDASNNLYATVNGRYIMLTAEQLTSIGFDVTKGVYVGFAVVGNRAPDLTINYIVSGDKESYDEVTGDANGDNKANVLDLARMKNNEEKDIKDILYYRTSSDLDKDRNSCDAEDLDLLRKELVK